MARRRQNKHHVGADVELDEVDTFSANQEKVLLENAGQYASRTQDEESSDEEVLGIDRDQSDEEQEEDDDEDDEDEEEEEEDREEDVKGWGSKKAYYGGDDASDDEDSKQMTEEAMRQQKQHLQDLAMDDYIDEDVMDEWKKTAEEYDEKAAPKSQFILNKDSSVHQLDDKERMEVLNQSFPEFVPLLSELSVLRPQLAELSEKSQSATKAIAEILEIKRVALAAYLSSIASYFAIFVDNLSGGDVFTSMKDSPVMETILTSREVWRQAGELREDIREQTEDQGELEGNSAEVSDGSEFDSDSASESEFVDARDGEESDISEAGDDFDIDISTRRTIKEATKKLLGSEIDDVDLEDKQRRKKTLRFYTSKIDQAQQKNADRYSGDLDLPYRERLFERQQRLIEEARKKGLGQDKAQLGDDLGEGEDDEGADDYLEEPVDGSNDADMEYYNSLQKSGIEKKKLRAEAHQLAVQAAKEGKLEEVQERLGKDGKRAINYQILKNKGLTPHRKKENRNSRVKKRNQYEKAKKKLKSVRQVYTGDSGPYQGEKTGIKKGLSRSVKLV